MQSMKHMADSLEKMGEIAKQFTDTLKKESHKATVVGLSGDLGSGKTTFVQHVAQHLGVSDEVTSPTFIIQKIYETAKSEKFSKLVHIDAYRLDASEQLQKIGFQEMLKEEDMLILVEWPEKVPNVLPEHTQHITFTFVNDTTREVTYGKE